MTVEELIKCLQDIPKKQRKAEVFICNDSDEQTAIVDFSWMDCSDGILLFVNCN